MAFCQCIEAQFDTTFPTAIKINIIGLLPKSDPIMVNIPFFANDAGLVNES